MTEMVISCCTFQNDMVEGVCLQLMPFKQNGAPVLRHNRSPNCMLVIFFSCVTHISPGTASCPPSCFMFVLLRFFLFIISINAVVCFVFLRSCMLILSIFTSCFQLMSGLLAASWLKWSGVVCCFQALIVSLSRTSSPAPFSPPAAILCHNPHV